ncbi:MAG: hypothetical protein ABR497_07590 [Kiritimatiellia bacterium]
MLIPVSSNKILFILAGLALLLGLGLRAAFFSISTQNVPATSDESIEFLMAKHIARGQPHLLVMSQPYRFPLESYVMAPLTPLLPRTPYGARIVMCLAGLLDVLLLLLILKATRPHDYRRLWPAALLILLPSAYLLMQQSAYRITGYTAMTTCSLLAILAALKAQRLRWAFVCGLSAGLAVSSTMLALPLAMVASLYAMAAGRLRQAPLRLAALLPGLGVGLLPYYLALLLMPGAHQQVADTVPLRQALARLTEGPFRQTVLAVQGFQPNLFPDESHLLLVNNTAGRWIFLACCLVFAALLLTRLTRIGLGLIRQRQLALRPWDIFLGIIILSVLAAVASRRFDSRSTRYLLPLAWCLPFICAGLLAGLPRRARQAFSLLLVILAVFNVYAGIMLMRQWRQPDFARNVPNLPDLRPAVEFLRQEDIRHCVASHWVAYRINFMTDEAILCSQPYNERFPHWPLPYKAEVDRADRVAYVLTERTRFLKPHIFERHLREMQVTSLRREQGDFVVYYDFSRPDHTAATHTLPLKALATEASHGTDYLPRLTDGNHDLRWSSRIAQQAGMWVQLNLPRLYEVNQLTIYYGNYAHDRAESMNLLARTTNGWSTIAAELPAELDKFAMPGNHPVYGLPPRQTIRGDTVKTDALRLEISAPRPRFNWSITGIEVGVADPDHLPVSN